MELFKYRTVALGCALFLAFLYLSYYMPLALRIVTIILSLALALCAILTYVIKKNDRACSFMLRAVPAAIFIILSMIISVIAFGNNEKLLTLCNEERHSAKAKITDISYTSPYFSVYEASLFEIDGIHLDCKVNLYLSEGELALGDIVSVSGVLQQTTSPAVGFDSRIFNLGKGIEASFSADTFTVISNEPLYVLDFLHRTNSLLDGQFQKISDREAYGVLSALFLGNKENLGLDIRRNFTRIGLNHVLALSGMHITIVVTIIGFALSGVPIRRLFKELILIASTLFFVGMTGFALSALRAGLMVCLAYSIHLFGGRISLTSALFISVTVICALSPYSIFSVSLILSFFAMLGCIVSSRIIKRYRLYRIFRRKLLRFTVFTFISTAFALLFTLPIMALCFGCLSLISPISNILVAPLFSVLIYLCPIYLVLSGVPYVSMAIGTVCTWITKLSLFLAESLSGIDGILIPITSPLHSIAVLLIAVFLFLLLTVKRKHLRNALFCVFIGVTVFAISSLALFIQRWNNVYVGIYSENGDIVFVEDEGNLTVVDLTDASSSKYILAHSVSEYLGYYEIETYILTALSSKSAAAFDNLSDSTIVKTLLLPTPRNDGENIIFQSLISIAQEKDISVFENKGTVVTENTKLTFAPTDRLPRSQKRTVAFCVDYQSTRFTYLGKSSYELATPFVDSTVYTSDIVVFGTFGPTFNSKYRYKMPYIDYAVFLADTINFASPSLIEELGDKAFVNYCGEPLRFCLTP